MWALMAQKARKIKRTQCLLFWKISWFWSQATNDLGVGGADSWLLTAWLGHPASVTSHFSKSCIKQSNSTFGKYSSYKCAFPTPFREERVISPRLMEQFTTHNPGHPCWLVSGRRLLPLFTPLHPFLVYWLIAGNLEGVASALLTVSGGEIWATRQALLPCAIE